MYFSIVYSSKWDCYWPTDKSVGLNKDNNLWRSYRIVKRELFENSVSQTETT